MPGNNIIGIDVRIDNPEIRHSEPKLLRQSTYLITSFNNIGRAINSFDCLRFRLLDNDFGILVFDHYRHIRLGIRPPNNRAGLILQNDNIVSRLLDNLYNTIDILGSDRNNWNLDCSIHDIRYNPFNDALNWLLDLYNLGLCLNDRICLDAFNHVCNEYGTPVLRHYDGNWTIKCTDNRDDNPKRNCYNACNHKLPIRIWRIADRMIKSINGSLRLWIGRLDRKNTIPNLTGLIGPTLRKTNSSKQILPRNRLTRLRTGLKQSFGFIKPLLRGESVGRHQDRFCIHREIPYLVSRLSRSSLGSKSQRARTVLCKPLRLLR